MRDHSWEIYFPCDPHDLKDYGGCILLHFSRIAPS